MPLPDICVQDISTCPNERPTIKLQQFTIVDNLSIQIRDRAGDPFVLTEPDNRVFLVSKIEYGHEEEVINEELAITDAANGLVSLSMAAKDLRFAGVYIGELIVFDTTVDLTGSSTSSSSGPSARILEQQAVYRQFVYICVEENITHEETKLHTLTIPEIRLVMRDKCSVDNFLLDKVEFTDTEIAWAIRRPIDYWNESHPQMRRFMFTAMNFPYRYYWTEAVIAELLRTAGWHYERNDLRYSAAGLSVEDKRKAEFYLSEGERVQKAFREWVTHTKVALNMTQGYSINNLRSFGNRFRNQASTSFF